MGYWAVKNMHETALAAELAKFWVEKMSHANLPKVWSSVARLRFDKIQICWP